MSSELTGFQREVGAWADGTFPQSDWHSIITHLRAEVDELREAVGQSPSYEPVSVEARKEAADCLLLLLHFAHKEGFDLVAEARIKHEANMRRTWETDAGAKGYWKHVEGDGS